MLFRARQNRLSPEPVVGRRRDEKQKVGSEKFSTQSDSHSNSEVG